MYGSFLRLLQVLKKLKSCVHEYTSHTREGGAHLKISAWHLLMNLKNGYLLKKLLRGPIRNVRILIFTMLYFKKKKERHLETSFYTCVPKILMI